MRTNKKRKSTTLDQATVEEIVHIFNDEVDPQRERVTFLKPLVNPFEVGSSAVRTSLRSLTTIFVGPDDEAAINKARKDEPDFVFLMGFRHVKDVSNLYFLSLLFFLKVVINV